jgi:VCBS repeat-containing protein
MIMGEGFDPLQYLASYGDLIEAFGTDTAAATQHYITNGQFEGRLIDGFDQEQYLRNYEDLSNAFGSDGNAATLHYITNGYFEGRTDRIIGFDGLQYIASYDDLIAAFGPNPTAGEQHYISNGRDEGRSTDLFDEKQYLVNYPDLAAAFGGNGTSATLHYIVAGAAEGRTDGPIPRPVDDAVTVAEDSGTIRFAVLGNDGSTAPGGGELTLLDVNTAGTLGEVDILRTGRIAYDPNGAFEALAAGQTGTDSFTYSVANEDGQVGTGRVTVTVTGANDAPVAVADAAATNEDAALPIAVLGNDTDVDNGTDLVVTAVGTGGTTGAVAIAADGKGVTYDPTGRFDLAGGVTATDTFTYTVSDGQGGSDTATVTVTVTGIGEPPPPPIAADDGLPVGEDSGSTTFAVLTNDTDFDGGKAGLTLVGIDATGTLGSVETTSRGRIVYDPNGSFETLAAGQTATDTFAYTIQNAAGVQDTATVTVTIEGANDAPVAVANTFQIREDAPATQFLVLEGDSDVDAGTVLTVASVDGTGASGTVDVAAGGTGIVYTPGVDVAFDETATDSFTYTVSDGAGGESTATVTMTILSVDPPPPPPPAPDEVSGLSSDFLF